MDGGSATHEQPPLKFTSAAASPESGAAIQTQYVQVCVHSGFSVGEVRTAEPTTRKREESCKDVLNSRALWFP